MMTGRVAVVRAILGIMASVVGLGGCTAANQQQAATTQELQRRYLCLQTAQKPGCGIVGDIRKVRPSALKMSRCVFECLGEI
jgi:hypothetical protein